MFVCFAITVLFLSLLAGVSPKIIQIFQTFIDDEKTFGSPFKTQLNGIKETLISLVVKGFGENPMVLITNQQLSLYNANQFYKTLDNYLTRWKYD